MKDNEIEEKFSDLIRERISNNVFWRYVASWQDGDHVAETMEDWDLEIQRDAVKDIKTMVKEEEKIKKAIEGLCNTLEDISEKDLEDIKVLRKWAREIKEYIFL